MPDQPSTDYRLFVALPVPETVRARLAAAQAELRRVVPQARITWAHRDQFHLTLKFLGDVPASRVEALTDRLRAGLSGVAPLPLTARGVGFFPNDRAPRVVWVGLHDAGHELCGMQSAVETACAEFTRKPAPSRFAAHVTLGRVKQVGRPEVEALNWTARALASTICGEWTAEGIDLMRSELRVDGARHTVLANFPLGKCRACVQGGQAA